MLEDLGVLREFLRRSPARISRCALSSGGRVKHWTLDEPGYGLSRLELDRLLLETAVHLGARLKMGEAFHSNEGHKFRALVSATGRYRIARRGRRLVGFKAHFRGPSDDAVELYFSASGYVGVSPVQDGLTNVCGIAPEDILKTFDFQIDDYLAATDPALAVRISPLSRVMPWLRVCPLVFSSVPGRTVHAENVYCAGDALAFVDPFTGSGILNALLTGHLAGLAAARLDSPHEHVRACRERLAQPFAVARVLRVLVNARLTSLATLVPGSWLYRLTRPRMIT